MMNERAEKPFSAEGEKTEAGTYEVKARGEVVDFLRRKINEEKPNGKFLVNTTFLCSLDNMNIYLGLPTLGHDNLAREFNLRYENVVGGILMLQRVGSRLDLCITPATGSYYGATKEDAKKFAPAIAEFLSKKLGQIVRIPESFFL